MSKHKIEADIVCSNVGIKPGSKQCKLCFIRKKCGALKYVNPKQKNLDAR